MKMASARAQQVTILFLHFSQNTNAKAWSRETGDGTNMSYGRPSSRPILRTSSLNSSFSGSNQAHLHLFRQATHVVVRFDDVCFTGCRSSRFDNVRVDGALRQPLHVFQFQRFFIEYFNENAPDDFTFASGSFSPASADKKRSSAGT
ncbi:Uncharacterised protein [Escherichia coli]|uniref:Uncharacterized protein n=1 Tax=Escherichia coli TaxID=562 RepID=A0A377K370_ECOLX|nr:Uncharacterised protein [Escherichia coli]